MRLLDVYHSRSLGVLRLANVFAAKILEDAATFKLSLKSHGDL